IYSLLNKIIAQKSAFGFTNIQDSFFSVSPTISIADEYLFYDDFHPTTTAHKLIAESVLLAIKDQFCQNSIMLNLLALAVGTSIRQRQLKKPAFRH
ncbi:MAG: GDSL family lipase, partial [Nostocaceae cyanobacterium]|nr:GDSL family lipase [Nostocaceae cyanobacterium]